METEWLYDRLNNDVFAYFYPDVYLLNQEGDINQFNTFKKKGWKYYRDGGRVIKGTKDYHCSYSFDFKDRESKSKKTLTFRSYNGSLGLNLLDFINSVLHSEANIFVKVKNLNIYDARKYLFDVVCISISYSIVDEMFFEILKRYFHKIEKIKFYNCRIKKECNLDKVSCDIEFNEAIIEDCRSLNHCKSNIYMIRSSIKKITPTTIESKKLDIACLSRQNDVDLKLFFLKCNFPNLISFKVNPEVKYDTYSFEDTFTFLPFSAPNLEEIIIEGNVRDLNFLTKFKYLIQCSILSIYDDMSLRYANITDKKEREKIFERNKYNYEIRKILFPGLEDKFIIANLEEERILRLCHFLSRLSYTEEDARILKEKDPLKALVTRSFNTDMKYYYECYYDTLHLKKQLSLEETWLHYTDMYRFFRNYLCIYNPYKTLFQKEKEQILQTKPFIIASNGIPIIFKERINPVRTMEEAKQKMRMAKGPDLSFEEQKYQEFVHFLKDYSKEMDEPILIVDFVEMIHEQLCYGVEGRDFLAFGQAGKRISYAFDTNKRNYKRIQDMREKVEKYKKLLVNIIKEKYDVFTVEEKAYIYHDKFDMRIAETKKSMERFNTLYETLVLNEEKVLQKINLKTNGLYSKYRNYIRCFTKLEYSYGNPYYSVYMKPEDIKQLVLHL